MHENCQLIKKIFFLRNSTRMFTERNPKRIYFIKGKRIEPYHLKTENNIILLNESK